MKRLLKNSIYVVAIAAILIWASRAYYTDNTEEEAGIEEIHEIALSGDTPQKKVDHIAYILETRHENVSSIVGKYELHPVTKTNYVQYKIHLRFEIPEKLTSFVPLDNVEKKRTEILGELAIATAELLSAEMHTQYIGENILDEMIFFVETVNYDSTTFKKFSRQDAYLFTNKHIKNLLSEKTTVQDWSKYQVPLEFWYTLPNTGTVEKQQPPPPK